MTTTLASFDVFDTLLTRRVADPNSVFAIVGQRARERGLVNTSPVSFQAARLLAERIARSGAPGNEANLDEIYTALADLLDLSPEHLEQLKTLELAIEEELIVPIVSSRAMVEQARREHGRVIFVSDMYLPEAFIRGQLERHGFFLPNDVLYVSSAHRTSKFRGMFGLIARLESVHPTAIVHRGNDPVVDRQVPERLGVRVAPVSEPNLNRYEQLLERYRAATDGASSDLAAASRLARLSLNHLTGREKVLSDIACSVVAPILTSFVIWVLRQARRKQLQRIYFVSRDGWLLLRIAQQLTKHDPEPLELRYLYGGRQAWHVAGLQAITDADANWIIAEYQKMSLASLLGRLAVDPAEVADLLQSQGWSREQWHAPIDRAGVERFWDFLKTSDAMQTLVLQKASQRRDLAVQYLTQEGLIPGVPAAYVDLGWIGRAERSLRRLLGAESSLKLESMYFGLAADALPEVLERASTFLFGGKKRLFPDTELIAVLESFCTAPHGTVVNYERNEYGVTPVFRHGHDDELNTWGHEIVHQSVLAFAECLAVNASPALFQAPLQEATLELFSEFVRNPSLEEAAAWGDFPAEWDQTATGTAALAPWPAMNVQSIWRAAYFGAPTFVEPSQPGRVWWGGAMQAMVPQWPTGLRWALRFGRYHAAVRRRIKRIVRRFREKEA
ncbi:MAG TPA: hypothetical protein VG713_05330 [Pirellulales bacterium]|nr:hypothetical protein [Pirellulales bacterium]